MYDDKLPYILLPVTISFIFSKISNLNLVREFATKIRETYKVHNLDTQFLLPKSEQLVHNPKDPNNYQIKYNMNDEMGMGDQL